jgi:glycosyltransferase involved in cell wall biosynthesis
MQYYDNPNNFVVIPNFISIELPNSFSNCHAKRAISVGRLSSAKGFDYLIKAWAGVHRQYPEWVCDIYGYGYGRENEYQQLIDENGLRNVVVIHEPVRNISEKYAAASFYVMTSRNEGFPLVLPEAMACGLPVVSFNCNSGPSEIITDGVDGILVNQVGDIPAMTFAICRMIKDEEMRIWMGKNALRNVQRYSQEKIMTEWVKLIESL